jgi:dipeptidyl aminopeptidase/acylaminoacyl peptidase
MQFLAGKGYWVFYPRYRGAWESGGRFLARSPHEDILDVITALPKGIKEIAFGRNFPLTPDEIFVIGGSFGGAAALLSSLDPRVKKVIANCPVVDWSILTRSEKKETSNSSYAAYVREAFGSAYRLSDRDWAKLRGGDFYNPVRHVAEITPSKIMMFHAKDDPYVLYETVKRFARLSGVKLNTLARGGHVKTEYIVEKYWLQIKEFFNSPAAPK